MKKREGFRNQTLIVVPPHFYKTEDPLISSLYLTDIGYFPRAEDHLVTRYRGSGSTILLICTDGSGWADIDGRSIELKQGQAVLIPSGCPHRYGSSEKDFWKLFWIHFRGELADEIASRLNEKKERDPGFALRMGDESRRLFNTICTDLLKGINRRNYELACGRLRHLFSSLIEDSRSGSLTIDRIIAECIIIMEDHLDSSLSLDRLSRETALTPPYLCRVFKQKTGHSPIDHYNRMKVQRACFLLDMTTLQVGEISRRLGIGDPYYFSRMFKSIMGLSPRDYRNR
jgi:AraC-like DNA-binding protein